MLDSCEIEAVTKVLSGTRLVHGPVAKELEQKFASRCGVKHAVSVSSCTAGLHLSLHVHDIGPGDEVLVPAMTHVATAHAVEYCGAKPVFVDVCAESGNIDPDALTDALGGKTRAAIVVHYLGLPCDMDRILPGMEKAGALAIEDCALAVDASYNGVKAGGLGLVGSFSFYPVKHMTTGEGGMITTNDDELAQKIARMKAFGYDQGLGERKVPGIYDVVGLGYNYRMSEIHAAIGVAQLDKLDQFQRARAENYAALKTSLDEIDELTVFEPSQGKAVSSHYCLNVVLPRDGSLDRASVIANLQQLGIGTSVHYPCAVPLFSYYRQKYGYRDGQFPVAEWLADQSVSLPVGPHLRAGDPEHIGAAIKETIRKVKR